MNSISFPLMFNKNNNKMSTNLSYNIKSINESLTSLILTSPGELLGDPAYGCGIKEKLFDIKNTINLNEIKELIKKAINRYVPYIIVRLSDIKIYSNNNNNKYKIHITYSLIKTNNTYDFELIV